MAPEIFDRTKLRMRPLSERQHKITTANIKKLDELTPKEVLGPLVDKNIKLLAEKTLERSSCGGKVIWTMGAHVLRRGNSRFIIDLMKRGLINHIAVNMAVAIHDFELSHVGATLEDVEFYIKDGRFGNWEETGKMLNQAISDGYWEGIGLGRSIGRMINLAQESLMPHRGISIFNAAYELGIPITVHKGIGYDITDQHPSADFEAIGKTSGDDFLTFVKTISELEGGVFLNLGSAVMGPEIYLKALSMARNVACQQGKEIRHFTTAVFDIMSLGNWEEEEAIVNYKIPGTISDPRYYFRPLKTILIRTIKDGGESFYIQGDFDATLPTFYKYLIGRA